MFTADLLLQAAPCRCQAMLFLWEWNPAMLCFQGKCANHYTMEPTKYVLFTSKTISSKNRKLEAPNKTQEGRYIQNYYNNNFAPADITVKPQTQLINYSITL